MFDKLRERIFEPELMDDLSSDERLLFRTLEQFGRINPLLTPNRALLRRYVVREMEPGVPRTLVDIGAGGGDIARWLVDTARARGLQLSVTCIDPDPRVARYCEKACADYPEIETRAIGFEELDESFDFVFCNHVVHHFTEEQALEFFDRTWEIARRLLIVSDLRRVAWATHGFRVIATFAFRDSFARDDGIVSIRRAFRTGELRPIVAESRWGDLAVVHSRVPARLLVLARKKSHDS